VKAASRVFLGELELENATINARAQETAERLRADPQNASATVASLNEKARVIATGEYWRGVLEQATNLEREYAEASGAIARAEEEARSVPLPPPDVLSPAEDLALYDREKLMLRSQRQVQRSMEVVATRLEWAHVTDPDALLDGLADAWQRLDFVAASYLDARVAKLLAVEPPLVEAVEHKRWQDQRARLDAVRDARVSETKRKQLDAWRRGLDLGAAEALAAAATARVRAGDRSDKAHREMVNRQLRLNQVRRDAGSAA
jgi:hypothetical protein